MSRSIYIKAKSLEDKDRNAIEICLFHSKERKCVIARASGVELRRENGMTITTLGMFGGARAKVMDMPRFSKAKFDAIPLDDLFMRTMVNKACEEDKMQLELDDKGEWVTI